MEQIEEMNINKCQSSGLSGYMMPSNITPSQQVNDFKYGEIKRFQNPDFGDCMIIVILP